MAPKRSARPQRSRREVMRADEDQVYGRVIKMMGNNRVKVRFLDKSERMCLIRGSMRRREWVNVGDIVLVCIRELAGDTADIVFRYLPAEVQRLLQDGEPVNIPCDEEEAIIDSFVTFADDEPVTTGRGKKRLDIDTV